MTSEEILYNYVIENFTSSVVTITEVSKSDGYNFIEMVSSAIDFDKISKQIGLDKFGSQYFSVDTILYCSLKNCIYLVEFKDAWPKSDIVNELRLKVYDSICMLKLISQGIHSDSFDFNEVKMKYIVITRVDSKQEKSKDSSGNYHPSFLDTLGKRKPFKLSLLDNTVIEKSTVLVTEGRIYDFLRRVTSEDKMIYHMKNESGQIKFGCN